MKHKRYIVLLPWVVALSACSTTPDCLEPQPYMQAKSFPALKSPPGLDVPAPDSATRIPQVGNGPVGALDEPPENADTDDPAARCLVTPPPMTQG